MKDQKDNENLTKDFKENRENKQILLQIHRKTN